MVLPFSPYLFNVLFRIAANVEECSRTTGQPCNARALYEASPSNYRAAATSDSAPGLCVRSDRKENGLATLVFKFENNGTIAYEESQQIVFTDVPDAIYITFGNDPNTTFYSTFPYGNYGVCFVGKTDDPGRNECHLLISDKATSGQITACMKGISRACPGPIYDTWNEELCT